MSDRRRAAYFLVDSLRYEIRRDLAEAMQEVGAITIEGAASTLPATTDFGMAALLPGADGTLTVVEHHGDLAPALGNRPLPGLAERRALLADRWGNRVIDVDLDELLSTAPRRLAARFGVANLIVVRTLDIDRLGEAGSLFRARKLMSDIIGDVRRAAVRLVEIGVQTLVFAADHGHILVPELPAGDVLAVPPGTWPLRKRRCLLGQARVSPPPGTVYTAALGEDSRVALYRLEVTLTAGTGKLRTPSGLEHGLNESLNRAWSYLQSAKDRLGLAPTLAQKDIVAEAIDLSGGRVECPCGVAFLAAMLSVIGGRRVQAGTVVLGDLTIQGNVKPLTSITEVLQLSLENGALRVLLPTGNKEQFSSLPENVVEKLDIIFYGDVDRAVARTVEL